MHCKCYIMPCSRACLWICRFQSFSMTFLQFPTHNAWQATLVPKCTLAPFRTFPKPQGEAAPGQAGAVMEGLEAFGPGDQFSAAGVVVWGMNLFYKRAHIYVEYTQKLEFELLPRLTHSQGNDFHWSVTAGFLGRSRLWTPINTRKQRVHDQTLTLHMWKETHVTQWIAPLALQLNFPNSPLLQHLLLNCLKNLSSLQN